MKRTAAVTMLMAMIFVSSSAGFDNHRQGFVLGGGIGFAPFAKWSVEDSFLGHTVFGADETRAGVGINILIGYAWDEKNMIVYEGNAAGYWSEYRDESIGQGFGGAAWYHYYGPKGKSGFTTAGLGLYSFDPEDRDANDAGFGVLLGGGYEFARHWQVGGYLSFGSSSYYGLDYRHSHFSVLVSGVAF